MSEASTLLICDGGNLLITANVDEMLRHLRKATKVRNLWIDAICINQSDGDEEASQVRLMGAIYERADKVHIWLGPATPEDNIPAVFDLLKWYALSTDTMVESQELHVRDTSNPLTRNLSSFLTRPWFTRRWVSFASSTQQTSFTDSRHLRFYKK
jgi:hypothetical protein